MSEAHRGWSTGTRPSSPDAEGAELVVDERRTLHLSGEIDLATGPELMAALEPFVERGGNVDLDVSGVTFIGAAGISVLHRTARALGARGRVRILHPRPLVQRVVDLTGLGDVVDVRPRPDLSPNRWDRRLRVV